MLGSVKYQIEGSKLTIETGVTPKGKITRFPVSDFHFHYRDEKGSLIRIEILGLGKVARMETAVNFGEWGEDKKAIAAAEKARKAEEVKIAKAKKAEATKRAKAKKAKGKQKK